MIRNLVLSIGTFFCGWAYTILLQNRGIVVGAEFIYLSSIYLISIFLFRLLLSREINIFIHAAAVSFIASTITVAFSMFYMVVFVSGNYGIGDYATVVLRDFFGNIALYIISAMPAALFGFYIERHLKSRP